MITLLVHTDDLNELLKIINLVSDHINVKRFNGEGERWVVSYKPFAYYVAPERVPVLVKTK